LRSFFTLTAEIFWRKLIQAGRSIRGSNPSPLILKYFEKSAEYQNAEECRPGVLDLQQLQSAKNFLCQTSPPIVMNRATTKLP
jgi:hypothetical protein